MNKLSNDMDTFHRANASNTFLQVHSLLQYFLPYSKDIAHILMYQVKMEGQAVWNRGNSIRKSEEESKGKKIQLPMSGWRVLKIKCCRHQYTHSIYKNKLNTKYIKCLDYYPFHSYDCCYFPRHLYFILRRNLYVNSEEIHKCILNV